jgi:hypothetical protein
MTFWSLQSLRSFRSRQVMKILHPKPSQEHKSGNRTIKVSTVNENIVV